MVQTAKVLGACTGGVTTYSWDAQDRLVRIDFPDLTVATYRYDGLGRRIEKNVNGVVTRYVYDGEDIVLEYDGANALQARYSHGQRTDQPLAIERGGASAFYHADNLGSVRRVTDAAGTVVNAYDTDAYGNFEARSEALAQPYAYTGREFDPESGLHYYRARYYDAQAGRFISEDPIGFSAQDSNFYRYAFGDPANLVDPSGLVVLAEDAAMRCFSTFAGEAVGGLFGSLPQTLLTTTRTALLSGTSLSTPALLGALQATTQSAVAGAAVGAATCAGPDFVTTPKGQSIPVPSGARGPIPTRAPGFQFIGGSGGKDLDKRVTGVRIMEANKNQGRRVIYMNERGQRVDPETGKTVSNNDPRAHHPLIPWE